MGRGWRGVYWGLALWALGCCAQAQHQPPASELSLIIVSSDISTPYGEAIGALTMHWVQGGFSRDDIRQMSSTELSAAIKAGHRPRPRVFVALGADACAALARGSVQSPVLCTLIPRGSFERVLLDSKLRVSSLFTALYLDQPLSRQLTLLRLSLPQVKRLGVLLGPESGARLPALKSVAATAGLTVVEARVDNAEGIFSALQQVLDGSDVLLAMADPRVYSSTSIQNILLSAFRAGVPMVGFSPAYVRAGALLALHVTPAQIGQQAAALLLDVMHDKALPANPVEPNDFEVAVNQHVARAMGLSLNAGALQQALRAAERAP